VLRHFGGRWLLGIALLPTLARRDNVEDITANYGFIIVDECHHVAAGAFFGVLSRIAARHWLGLTAPRNAATGSKT
jgi:superfamily II DNA or RNA helicase